MKGVAMAKAKRTAQDIQGEINSFKLLLTQSDYKALKHADGVISDEEYAEALTEREGFRARINELEAELAALGDSE